MAHTLTFDASLHIRDNVDMRKTNFISDEHIGLFDEWFVNEKDRSLMVAGVVSTHDVHEYLADVNKAMKDIARYICDGEDAYVIDTDGSWPSGWRFVFQGNDVKCYEGMMIFIEEVKM